jgi:AcrR family transcriptional regulator
MSADNHDAKAGADPSTLDGEVIKPFALSGHLCGPNSLPPELVEANQRERLIAGALDVLAERGYLATSVDAICTAASISPSTFYGHFTDAEACVLAAYDLTVAWLSKEVLGTVDLTEDWPHLVRYAVTRTLELLEADNRLARLLTIEVFFAGVRGEVRHRALVDRLSLLLGVGRGEHGTALPLRLEPTLVGGAFSLVARQLGGGEGNKLRELAPELTQYLLAPYLGVEAAREIAAEGTDR